MLQMRMNMHYLHIAVKQYKTMRKDYIITYEVGYVVNKQDLPFESNFVES